MIKQKNIQYIVFLISILLFSCSKFEDGPKISLLSKNKRISRIWKVEYSINLSTNIEHSADFDGWTLEFSKDGTYNQNIIYGETQNLINGNWEFIGDNQIRLNFNSASGEQIAFYTILRLSKKELWLKDEKEEIHYYSE
ncbi:MAG: hypothetical protein L3J74_12400 [Bacteroidales bacterium]|nr:hypothetical protein [Bacteroidales bacterium]